jgi:uncharacterized protein YdeI (YjbR/CyaY-like superfamily)
MTKAGLHAVNVAKQDGSWDRLNDIETDALIPDDLAEAFVENPIAMKFFNNLSPSYQKQYLWWLKSAKKLETRRNRLLSIIERCARGLKPGI